MTTTDGLTLTTAAELDALVAAVLGTRWPDGARLDGVTKRTAQMIAEQVAPLLAEAEARGVARGRREALIDLRSRVYNGAPDPYQAFYNYGLAPLLDAEIERAAETPGGAA